MLKFYHYTQLFNYHVMERYSRSSCGQARSALQCNAAMIAPVDRFQAAPHLSFQQAIFGLTEPEPENWWRETHPTGRPVLEVVMDMHSYSGGSVYDDQIALLEVNVDEDVPVYVADWGVHLDADSNWDHKRGRHSSGVKRAYAKSLVPLKEYHADMNYCLPEVVCFEDVPFERLRIVERDVERFLCQRMREKYGHPPREYMYPPSDADYICPIAFE